MQTLDPIYPVTALQKKPAELKEAARHGVIRITENGVGAYVFASEEVFEQCLRKAAAQAVEEALLAETIERGRADMASNRFFVGDEAWSEIERRAAAHG